MPPLPPLITENLAEIRALCEKYQVKKLTLFGSAVKGTFDPEKSDVDFLVEILPLGDPVKEGRAYLNLWRDLRKLLGREVDLIDPSTIDNPYLAESIFEATLELYAA